MRKIFMMVAVASALSACGGYDGTPSVVALGPVTANDPIVTSTIYQQNNAQSYSSFGVKQDPTTLKYTYQHFGNVTPTNRFDSSDTTTPTLSGTAIYTGHVGRVDSNGKFGNVGESVLQANFTSKTINGGLYMNDNNQHITLKEGTIDGTTASFSGVAQVASDSIPNSTLYTGTYSGNFYGSNAEEVAGTANFTGLGAAHSASFGGTR